MLERYKALFKKDFSKVLAMLPLLMFAAVFLLGSASHALAQNSNATSFGGLVCNIYNNIHGEGGDGQGLNNLFCWIAYAAGAVFVVQSIYHFKLHTENPSSHPLYRPVALILGGAALMATPGIADVIITSYYPSGGAGANLDCAATAPAAAVGLDGALINFVKNVATPLQMITSAVAIISGIYMIVHGLMKASKYGFDPKSNSVHHILTYLGFGALLITIGETLDSMLATVFGDGATAAGMTNQLSWSIQGLSPQFTTAVNAGLQFIQVIGAIAFVRGWMILKKVVEGGGNASLAQGLSHILGGVLAVNIFAFLKLMDTTLGTGLLS